MTCIMNMIAKLPTEIIDKIVMETSDMNAAVALRSFMSTYAYDKMEKRVLIYGHVQSGKTKEIINFIKTTHGRKVLVIQNSLLVLSQYMQRLTAERIDFQVISKETEKINHDVIIIMNNNHRYNYFKKFCIDKYILLLDESDQTIVSCPLKG